MLALVGTAGMAATRAAADAPAPLAINARALPAIGRVSERFLSYNIEMVEVTGGRFWRPYGSAGTDRYEYRAPLDLANPRLRRLAAALAPAYVRYSGTWANATWFADSESPPSKAPAGFDTILTRKQWRGAVAFAKASNAQIVTSFAVSAGTHDGRAPWNPQVAERWLAYTRQIGGRIAATEFGNEPNSLSLLKGPPDYSIADYRRDYAIFARWLRQASPGTLLLAPGYAELGEPIRTAYRAQKDGKYEASDLLLASDPRPNAVSFHFYGTASERCGGAILRRTDAQARDPKWLAAIDAGIARTAALRDAVAPGAPLWDTESAESVCGGNPLSSGFADTFRFVDHLARSARQGVSVFIHNTLAASDYGLLDEGTYTPRPNYWAAVLWKRLVGARVLDAGGSGDPQLNLYAHCLKGRPGGVALVAINLDAAAPRSLALSGPALRYTLTAGASTKSVLLNGTELALGKGDVLPTMAGVPARTGAVSLPAASVTYLALPNAGNRACLAGKRGSK